MRAPMQDYVRIRQVMQLNPFVRTIPCVTCTTLVAVKPLGIWGHEVIRCSSCRSAMRVRYRIPSFVLTFIVLTLVYGLIWLVPWQGKAMGIAFLVVMVVATPVFISWVLGEFMSLENAPENASNSGKTG